MNDVTKIFVYLLDEGVDVWRPVDAKRVEGDLYRIPEDTIVPDGETWQFPPGTIVRCIHGELSGEECLIAMERP